MSGTLFEKYGGFKSVSRIVMTFYDMVLDDDDVGPVFEGTDMARLIDHQTKFVSALMGGPVSYSNEHLARAHHHLGITPDEYAEMGEIFKETLEDHDLPDVEVERLPAHIISLHDHVVGAVPAETK